MNAFLDSIGYGHWILHVLMVIPLLGIPVLFLVPARSARWVALVVALIELVLGQAAGNLTHAASMLGIDRNTLRKKMQQLRIKG